MSIGKKTSKLTEYIMYNSFLPTEKVISAIRALDADGNGYITLNEVVTAIKSLIKPKE
jgi:Ca2+-binding EF-hand superfamily protein